MQAKRLLLITLDRAQVQTREHAQHTAAGVHTFKAGKTATPITPDPELHVKGKTYRLQAVVVHRGGSTNSGHYVSYIKLPLGMWWCYHRQPLVRLPGL